MTKAKFSCLLACFLALFTCWQVARAAEENSAPRSYVVLVGISNYADKQIKPRQHGEDDAKALYDLFTDKSYLGVDAKHVRLLLGTVDPKRSSEQATKDNIVKALNWVATQARPNDLVIYAFIGEGAPLGDAGDRRCYFAVDSTVAGREKDAVAANDIGEIFKNLKSQHFCTFLDVDFKGFTGTAKAVAEPTLGNNPYSEFLGDDGSEDHAPIPGRVLFLATNGLSTSLDLEKHGLFTQTVLEGLKGEGDKEGYEADGLVTVDELIEYLDKVIPAKAREVGKTKEEKQQIHFVLGGRSNHYALTSNPAVKAKVDERLAKFEEMVKSAKVPARLLEEGKLLLGRMPRLEAQRSLRKSYQQLVDGGMTLDQFQTSRGTILDGTKLREVDAVRYARKVMEAIQMIKDGYVKDVNMGELTGWAIKGLYRRIDEKIPEEIQAKLKNVKDLSEDQLVVLLAEARKNLGKREDLDTQKDLNITLQRMLAHLDPYTTYIDPETLDNFRKDVQGDFKGIGIQIRKDSLTDQLLVVSPIKGSPAHKAGLQAGDLITKITREVDSKGNPLNPPEVLPTKGLMISDAVKKIQGQSNTKVKLTIQREGVEKPIDFEIIRGRIVVETVLGANRKDDDEWNYLIDDKNKIGYIRLTQFSRDSARDMARVMADLTRKGIKGFILDLRFNPGGLLDSAVKITDMYIDDGLIVSVRPRVGRESKSYGFREGSMLDFPMVCLVNGYSASGSEIVSAALQDHKRALIIGERSYGKGSVQNIQDFENGEIKMTTASFWRPSNKNLNKSSTSGKPEEDWGVRPDVEIALTRTERENLADHQHKLEIIQRPDKKTTEPVSDFKDQQLDKALEYLREQIKTASRLGNKKAG